MLASEPKHVNYILNKIENFNMEKLFFLFFILKLYQKNSFIKKKDLLYYYKE